MKKILLLPLLPLVAFADTETADGIARTYCARNGGAAFDGCTNMTSLAVDDANGDVVIPDGVKSIGSCAFENRVGLTSVIIPEGVTSIEYDAFKGCGGLASVTIPASVRSIGLAAFEGCGGIMAFAVDATNEHFRSVDGMLCSKDGRLLRYGINGNVTIPPTVTVIARDAFKGHDGLKSVVIPPGVTDIRSGAFAGCGGITSFSVDEGNPRYSAREGILYSKDGTILIAGVNGDVVIPEGVKIIGEGAFEGRVGLRSVTIPKSVREIGYAAFRGCDGLESVTIPEGVQSVRHDAFADCRSLTSLTIPSSVVRISRSSIARTPVERVLPDGMVILGNVLCGYNGWCPDSLSVPSNVTSIVGFDRSSNPFSPVSVPLRSATIPSSVRHIAHRAFAYTPFYNDLPDGPVILGDGVFCGYKGDCPADVTLPTNVKCIGDEAFSNVKGIGDGTFSGRQHLKSVTIPASVTSIGEKVFRGCLDGLTVTMCGERPTALGDVFASCGRIDALRVPVACKSWAGMREWQGVPLVFYGKSVVNGLTWTYSIRDGRVTVDAVTDEAHQGDVPRRPSGRVAIPAELGGASVTEIRDGVFAGCSTLVSVAVPAGVKAFVREGAWSHRRTGRVWRGVAEWKAFDGCIGLTAFEVDAANATYSSRNGLLCTKDGKTILCGIGGDVTIPSDVTNVVMQAFEKCTGLKSVTIPESLTNIVLQALVDCPNLHTVDVVKDGATVRMDFDAFRIRSKAERAAARRQRVKAMQRSLEESVSRLMESRDPGESGVRPGTNGQTRLLRSFLQGKRRPKEAGEKK